MCRRKPALSFAIVLVLVLVLVLGIGSPIAAYRINQARKAEASERLRAERNAQGETRERQRAEAEALHAQQNLYAAHMLLTQQALAENNIAGAGP